MEAELGAGRVFGRSGSGRGLVVALLWLSAFALTALPLFAEGSPAPKAPTLVFSIKDDLVNLDAVGQPLDRILDIISRQLHIGFVKVGNVGSPLVNAHDRNLPLDQAVRQLLQGFDSFMYYRAGANDRPPALAVVWIYPKGGGRGVEPVPTDQWASTAELRKQLSGPDPDARMHAIDGLVERDHTHAANDVLAALRDSDEHVRSDALYSAETEGVELPADVIGNMARNDPSATVRFLALSGLEGRPEAAEVAKDLMSDSSPFVQKKAAEMLDALNPKPRAAPRAQQTPLADAQSQ